MRILHRFIALLLISTALAVTSVTPQQNLCTCVQIQYQSDCLAVSIPNSNPLLPPTTCTWTPNLTPNTTPQGTCSTTVADATSTVATYCSGQTIATCASTLGCALPDGQTCQAFTGCSAYVLTTNAGCQAVSNQCTTDGTQCANKQPCSYYNSQISNCGLYSSSSGTGTCKVSGGQCVDQICSDAPSTMTTDTACNSFLAGCVTNGVGCATTRISCNSQTGSSTTCPIQIGLLSEGYCKYSGSGTACTTRTCVDAPTSLNTNAQCIAFLSNCYYTIGYGCVPAPSKCAQLNYALGCTNLTNTSGVGCTNDTTLTNTCRELICSDNVTATTNEQCNTKGLTGCLTIGQGCVSSANFLCSYYSGNNFLCSTLTASNGPCKGNASKDYIVQPCVPKTCADAPNTINSNAGCAAIQVGCYTTGYGCVTQLLACNTYTPTDSTPCDGYQGSDGPCTILIGATTCSARTCAGASTTKIVGVVTTTNSGCQAWSGYRSAAVPGCVTDGTKCIAPGPCSSLSATSCQGFNNCSFVSSCVQSGSCYNYLNQSQCISNIGQFGRGCQWSTVCYPLSCPISSASIISDSICQSQTGQPTPGCYYQGPGSQTCIDGVASPNCSQFSGDNSFVANQGCAMLYGGRCASQLVNQNNGSVRQCTNRTCALFYQSPVGTTSDPICIKWLKGCVSNGYQGCVQQYSVNDVCGSYLGTQATCNTIFANLNNPDKSPSQQCYNLSTATASTPCVPKTASIIVQTTANMVWTEGQCVAQLAGTVSSLVGVAVVGQTGVCKDNTSLCPSFLGSYSQCTGLNLTTSKCTKFTGFCYPKIVPTCSSLNGASITACNQQYHLCTWTSGTTCTSIGACTSYTATAANCNALYDLNGLRCGSKSSTSASCIYANWCTDFNTGGSGATTTCPLLKDALGNTCTAINATDAVCSYRLTPNTYALGVQHCTLAGYTVSNGLCTAVNLATTACTSLSGAFYNSVVNCQSGLATCTWVTGTSCIVAASITVCTTYNLPGGIVPTSSLIGNTYCLQFAGAKGICQYNGAATPTDTTCAEPPTSCASITNVTAGQSLTQAICSLYQNQSLRTCGFASATACAEPAVCSAITGVAVTLAGAQQCAQTVDSTVFTPCSAPSLAGVCQNGMSDCTFYLASQANDADNGTMCQMYFNSLNVKCGFQAGAANCSNRQCNDVGVTVATCSTYLGTTCGWNGTSCTTARACSNVGVTQAQCANYIGNTCAWNGTACVLRSSIQTCFMYPGTSAAQCALLFDKNGRQCTWVASATTCSDVQCSTLTTAASSTHAQCQALNLGCTASTPAASKGCQVVQTSCFKYFVTAANLADCFLMYDASRIQCTAPTAAGPCTYDNTTPKDILTSSMACLINPGYTFNSGTNTCTGTNTIVTCASTLAVGSDFATKLNYCKSLTSVVYGTPCFFSQYSSSGVANTYCVDRVTALNVPNCSAANLTNSGAPGTGSDADCANFSTGCTATISLSTSSAYTPCVTITCDMATGSDAVSTASCLAFLSTCIWNGTNACVPKTTACPSLTGTVSGCTLLVGNGVPCYQPTATAISTPAACATVTCANAPSSFVSNEQCESWYQSKYNANYKDPSQKNLNCVWTGTTGCVSPQICSSFAGTAITCPKLIAIDGPCKAGLGNFCTPNLCADAPNSYTTDAQCAAFANASQACLTNGYGCVAKASLSCTSLVSQTSCNASSLGGAGTNVCSWLPTCVGSVTSCTDSSLNTPSLCTTTPVKGATCIWNTTITPPSCTNITCSLLPVTYTTNQQCQQALSTCATNGAGCVTLGPCSSYTYWGQQVCEVASNKEVASNPQITKCIWSNSQCRVVTCTDNTTATTNTACNSYGLTGCVTTGKGCAFPTASAPVMCSSFTVAANCIVDGTNNPCLWINGSCQNYLSCTSIAWTTHSQCQLIITNAGFAPGCTTNGTNCVPLNSCSNYTTPASCTMSNKALQCGWLPANSKGNTTSQCAIFGACTDAAGTTTSSCQLYGSSCISNGTSCQLINNCASYTQYACQNSQATDGYCFWVSTTTPPSCRPQQCSDAALSTSITSPTTDAGCAAFPAPVINTCTTNGTTCINRAKCETYTTQGGCIQGTDGQCIWVASTSGTAAGTCRLMQCTDVTATTNSACLNRVIATPAISVISKTGIITTTPVTYLNCVSNGVTCIAQSTCSKYTNIISCQAGGTDGNCAFTPAPNVTNPAGNSTNTNGTSTNSTTTNNTIQTGTCAQMSSCSVANSDYLACTKASDRCFWGASYINATNTTCTPITCAQKASGLTCKPVPSFNYATYTICAPVSSTNATCVPADGSANPAQTCFSGALGQYTWNDTTNTCSYCYEQVTVNNTKNTTTTINNTNTTTNNTVSGTIPGFLIYGAILAMNL